jgi:uncharacterized protein YjbI with pentapeptide repeats
MDSGEVMGKHRERVEQENKPGTKSPVEKEPRTRHWSSKLWEWTDFGEKKLWDWLQLLSALAIPIVLAGAGFWFSAQQDSRQQAIEDQRAQDVALQAYLDQMGALMLEENLRDSERDSEPRTLARARTVTVLGRLDPKRKRSAVQFLYESSLIDKANPVVDLSNADLSSVDLHLKELIDADLDEVDLSEADLSGADLSGATLANAILSDADLRDADIRDHASLVNADLSDADLRDADLTDANLTFADLRGADLRGAQGVNKGTLKVQYVKLEGATMPNGQKYED